MNDFCSNVQLAASFDVWVPCTHPKTNKDALEKASIFLPHMMFAALGQNYPEVFSKLFGFGKGQLAEFWSQVAKTGDDKLKGHPMSLEKDWEKKTIPLFVHGDGVDYANNDNLLVFSWGCLASNLPTLLNHWLLACFPKSCGKKETWKPFGNICTGPLKHWHVAGTPQWTQMASLWERALCFFNKRAAPPP